MWVKSGCWHPRWRIEEQQQRHRHRREPPQLPSVSVAHDLQRAYVVPALCVLLTSRHPALVTAAAWSLEAVLSHLPPSMGVRWSNHLVQTWSVLDAVTEHAAAGGGEGEVVVVAEAAASLIATVARILVIMIPSRLIFNLIDLVCVRIVGIINDAIIRAGGGGGI